MAVAVPSATSSWTAPVPLLQLPISSPPMATDWDRYDVSGDGQKFLVPIRESLGVPLQVVVNWQSELKA